MAADDNLNPKQFPRISVDRLLRMPSVDALDPRGGKKPGAGDTLADVIHEKHADLNGSDPYWRGLQSSWDDEGQQTPVHVFVAGEKAYGQLVPAEHQGKMMMGDGGHRVAMAHQRGQKSVMFTTDQGEAL